MSDVIVKPAFQSAYVDSGDTTKFGPASWNAARIFSGGAKGDLLFRDTGSATGASYLPDVAIGSVLISGGVGANPAWSAAGAVGQSLITGASGLTWAERSRVLTASTTQVGTDANQNEKDLWSYPMPGGTLNADGRGVRIFAWGTLGANANNKTIRLYFGSLAIGAFVSAGNNVTFHVNGFVFRSGASAEVSFAHGVVNGTIVAETALSPTEATAGGITIRVTGQNGVSSANDAVLRCAFVELLN